MAHRFADREVPIPTVSSRSVRLPILRGMVRVAMFGRLFADRERLDPAAIGPGALEGDWQRIGADMWHAVQRAAETTGVATDDAAAKGDEHVPTKALAESYQ